MEAVHQATEISFDKQTKWLLPLAWGCISCTLNWILIDINTNSYIWNCSRPHFYQRLEALLMFIVSSFIVMYIAKLNICHYVGKKNPAKEYSLLVLFCVAYINAGLVFVAYCINRRPLFLKDILVCNVIVLPMTLIGYFYIRYKIYNAYYTQQSLQLEKIKSQQFSTELEYLKAQYHPHFLFNALNTVYFKIDEDNTKAKHSVELLSNLLRYQIYDIKNQVTIEQEIEHIKDFIEFQKMEESERLSINLSIDVAMPKQLLHPLLFQPLIENAFNYSHGNKTNITCSIRQTTKEITFSVQNTISPNGQDLSESGNVGIENLKRRLKLLYPNSHKLEFEHTSETVKATLTLNTSAKQ